MLKTLRAVLFLALAAATVPVLFAPALAQSKAVATFGSGCFWCTEADFDKVAGVLETTSGFMGGKTPKPTYNEVVTGRTGHVEVVQVTYDPAKVSYDKLLEVYWRNVDPFDARGQFCDKGSHYRPVIFVHTPEQRKAAEASRTAVARQLSKRFDQPIVVKIEESSAFTAAEAYHQNFYKTNARRYSLYRAGCGRDARLAQIWGNSG